VVNDAGLCSAVQLWNLIVEADIYTPTYDITAQSHSDETIPACPWCCIRQASRAAAAVHANLSPALVFQVELRTEDNPARCSAPNAIKMGSARQSLAL